ncbi:MAG: phosphatase PAP2 family protein [Nocardioidaceae bacterium]
MPTKRAAATVLVSWAVLAVLVVGAGWLLTHPWQRGVAGFDDPISRWFARQRTPALTEGSDPATFLGETPVGVALVVVVAVAFALWRRSWRPLVFAAVVEAGLGAFYWLGTHLDPRARPPVRILDPGLVPDASFPSGHVATATAVAGCAVALAWAYAPAVAPWLPVLAVLPVWTLLARLYVGAHHLTDALTSLVYATVWVGAVALSVLPLRVEGGGAGIGSPGPRGA